MINEQISVDRRDWNSLRDRVIKLEEDNRRLHNQMALFMNGCKERIDVFSVLLARFEADLARKDV